MAPVMVIDKIKELQKELETELDKEERDEVKIKKLRTKIFNLGLQITRSDIYLRR